VRSVWTLAAGTVTAVIVNIGSEPKPKIQI
jgi:hypothetical protein